MIEALVILNIALQLADAYTTIRIIRQGGRELNPLLLWLDGKLKAQTNARWAWLAVKCAVASVLILALYGMGEALLLAFLVALQGYVVYRNYLQIK